MSQKWSWKQSAAVIVLAAAAVCIVLLWKQIGTPLVRFVSEPEVFRGWVAEHGAYSRIAFVGMVIFQVLIAVIPGEPFELAAGYAFGAAEGTALSIFGAAAGSMLTFWLVRLFGMKLIRLFFSQEQIDSVRFLKGSRRQELLFFIVYTIPGTPKDLLGYFAGMTQIRPGFFLLICTLGRIPSVITSTIGGNALGTKEYVFAVIVFGCTAAISLAGLIGYNAIRKKEEKGESSH